HFPSRNNFYLFNRKSFYDRSVFYVQFQVPGAVLFHELDGEVLLIGNGKFRDGQHDAVLRIAPDLFGAVAHKKGRYFKFLRGGAPGFLPVTDVEAQLVNIIGNIGPVADMETQVYHILPDEQTVQFQVYTESLVADTNVSFSRCEHRSGTLFYFLPVDARRWNSDNMAFIFGNQRKVQHRWLLRIIDQKGCQPAVGCNNG